ncbi:MAG TPA: CPBP family intramembrane glutamic endopeptidase [Rhizomicrobium sp.]|nr:CPBP family intramembrane glutamic endopeptidase [Rhizomicrobium sp.]
MSDSKEGARGAWAWWPLRLVVFFVALIAIDIGCQFGRAMLLKHAPQIPRDTVLMGENLAIAVTMIIGYRLLVRWTERRNATELGFAQLIPGTLGGALLGFMMFCAVYAVLWSVGVASIGGFAGTSGLVAAIAMPIGAAVGEEILFRGAVYRLIEEGFGTVIALLFSAALFGLIHLGNPGATPESSIAIAIEAGLMLAAAYALTRSLWLPIGLHFGWNFTEGGVFGAAVSGGTEKGLIHAPLSGPSYLTGGQFGPEASIAAVGIGFVVTAVMLVLAAQRGQWKPMRVRLRSPGEA